MSDMWCHIYCMKLKRHLNHLQTFNLGAHDDTETFKSEISYELIFENHSRVHDASHAWQGFKFLFERQHLILVRYVDLYGNKKRIFLLKSIFLVLLFPYLHFF